MGGMGYVGEGRPLRAFVVGFGNVGRNVAEILLSSEKYPGVADLDVSIVGILTKTRGVLLNQNGIDLRRALDDLASEETGHRFSAENPDFVAQSVSSRAMEYVNTPEFDVLIELSPLSVETKGRLAIENVRSALEARRHVITANKGPVAWAYGELKKLAARNGVHFLMETTVMDGMPVFNLSRHCMKGARIRSVEGILNSTSNWVLEGLENGMSFDDAVKRAQAAGIAEADPSCDIDGWDAAVKIAALANGVMDMNITPDEVERESIRGITPETVAGASARGARLKMICRCSAEGASVKVEEIPKSHLYASVNGVSAVVTFRTDLLGEFRVVEEGTESLVPTAYGVIGDLLELRDLLNAR